MLDQGIFTIASSIHMVLRLTVIFPDDFFWLWVSAHQGTEKLPWLAIPRACCSRIFCFANCTYILEIAVTIQWYGAFWKGDRQLERSEISKCAENSIAIIKAEYYIRCDGWFIEVWYKQCTFFIMTSIMELFVLLQGFHRMLQLHQLYLYILPMFF